MATSLLACPTGCGRGRRPNHLMCAPCWRLVPAALQRDVYRTWRAFEHTGSDERWEAYSAARDAAIASLP